METPDDPQLDELQAAGRPSCHPPFLIPFMYRQIWNLYLKTPLEPLVGSSCMQAGYFQFSRIFRTYPFPHRPLCSVAGLAAAFRRG